MRLGVDLVAFRHLEQGVGATGEENGSGCGRQFESRVFHGIDGGKHMRGRGCGST